MIEVERAPCGAGDGLRAEPDDVFRFDLIDERAIERSGCLPSRATISRNLRFFLMPIQSDR